MGRSLSGPALAVFQARYDGRMATARQLAQELRWTPVEVIDYARELGLRNGEQPPRHGAVHNQGKRAHASPADGGDDERATDSTDTTTDRDDDDDPGDGGACEEVAVMAAPDDDDKTKPCARCGMEKPLWDFAPAPRAPDGRGRFCAACRGALKEEEQAKAAQKRAPEPDVPTEGRGEPGPAQSDEGVPGPPRVYSRQFERELPLWAASQVRESGRREIDVLIGMDNEQGLLLALLQKLPKDNRWDLQRRELWMRAFGAVLDLVIEVRDDEPQPQPWREVG